MPRISGDARGKTQDLGNEKKFEKSLKKVLTNGNGSGIISKLSRNEGLTGASEDVATANNRLRLFDRLRREPNVALSAREAAKPR